MLRNCFIVFPVIAAHYHHIADDYTEEDLQQFYDDGCFVCFAYVKRSYFLFIITVHFYRDTFDQ